MRPPRRPRPPSPAPAPAPSPASPSRDASHSPPSPYAAAFASSPGPSPVPGPGPAPEPSAAARAPLAGGGRRAGGSLSPPLIAMLAVVGAALLVVLYARLVSRVFRAARRRWRRRRLRLLMAPGGGGGSFSPSSARGGDGSFASFTTYDNYYHTFSPYCGLDAAAIKSLPSAQYLAAAARGSGASRECAVCLLEFADGDELRALPLCAHAFHADCIDVWLRAHASCPLCRAAVALPPPVASPLHRAARRVRPSLDDLLFFHPVPPGPPPDGAGAAPEIAPASPDQLRGARDFLLKRSYSFGFERSLAVEAASTASPPWRYRAAADGATSRGRSFWSKRWPSPFGGGGGTAAGSAAARVFSFRSYRSAAGKSSPFSRRRAHGGAGSGFFMSLASEPPSILAAARRGRAAAASSRLRCGDPEALLSPDRLSR
ncbi:RING-H2 finger protein ATL65 [Panicum miliaceum]|uniref:RING-type E3 ubiquitin transferase n=1 Tax=Panicum miliaceum TaxID=4540 RepID=A0A3L6SVE7_PANMI|nr:RING-H2 finger protein ATL65 [Panicum miliaceum]